MGRLQAIFFRGSDKGTGREKEGVSTSEEATTGVECETPIGVSRYAHLHLEGTKENVQRVEGSRRIHSEKRIDDHESCK